MVRWLALNARGSQNNRENVVNFQVKEQAGNTLVIIYQHVGERLRTDLAKKDIHPAKYVQTFVFIVTPLL